jgi:hypothetical protein
MPKSSRKIMYVRGTILALFLSGLAGLAVPTLASSFLGGPEGTNVNGYFKDAARLTLQYAPINGGSRYPGGGNAYIDGQLAWDCSNYVGYNGTVCFIFARAGTHRYKVWQNQYGDIFHQTDGTYHGILYGDSSAPNTNHQTLYDGTITVDKQNPSLSVFGPSNNSNTDKSTITVYGEADDGNESGISSVTVTTYKAVQASVNGKNFSAEVPLQPGLNSISVSATDKVGRIKTYPTITILRSSNGTGSVGTAPSQQAGGQSSSGPGATATDDGEPGGKDLSIKENPPTEGKDSFLIKGLKNGGLALGGILGVTASAFLLGATLNRFGVIKAELPVVKRLKKLIVGLKK